MATNPQPFLQRVRIVLVGSQHPGNIGASARAMKTMGLHDLWLVRPRSYPHPEAAARAAGGQDLLSAAHVVSGLDEALADCVHVAGTSARSRYLAVESQAPRDWARRAAAIPDGRIALLFGCERSGLTNAQLDRCRSLVRIPADPGYSSLNLAQAVQVMAYELRLAAAETAEPAARVPASQAELERFFEHLQRVLVATGFLNPDRPQLLMRRLRRLYARAAPDDNEVNILRGILTAVETSLRRR